MIEMPLRSVNPAHCETDWENPQRMLQSYPMDTCNRKRRRETIAKIGIVDLSTP